MGHGHRAASGRREEGKGGWEVEGNKDAKKA